MVALRNIRITNCTKQRTPPDTHIITNKCQFKCLIIGIAKRFKEIKEPKTNEAQRAMRNTRQNEILRKYTAKGFIYMYSAGHSIVDAAFVMIPQIP